MYHIVYPGAWRKEDSHPWTAGGSETCVSTAEQNNSIDTLATQKSHGHTIIGQSKLHVFDFDFKGKRDAIGIR